METSRQTLEDMAKITSGAGASSEDLANRNETPVPGSDSYALMFLFERFVTLPYPTTLSWTSKWLLLFRHHVKKHID